MKKQLTKIFVTVLVVLLTASFFGAFSAPVAGQTTTDQEKAMDFTENVLLINLSKYKVNLTIDFIMDGVPLANDNRKIHNLMYELNSENSNLKIYFTVEKDKLVSYNMVPLCEQVITTNQYNNRVDAVKGFLERYQTRTKIDSSNLIAMLDKVDITKNSTTTLDNTQLTVLVTSYFNVEEVIFTWTNMINGAGYGSLELTVDENCFISAMCDTRLLYTIGDTSVNISEKQAIDIALENLKFYSYAMPDGSIVKDFKVHRDNIVATLFTSSVDYELRPYWDIRMILDEVYPGNVHGITAFIDANTGEVISYSNMAYGGVYDDSTVPNTSNSNTLIIGIAIVAVIAAVTTGILITKKKQK